MLTVYHSNFGVIATLTVSNSYTNGVVRRALHFYSVTVDSVIWAHTGKTRFFGPIRMYVVLMNHNNLMVLATYSYCMNTPSY